MLRLSTTANSLHEHRRCSENRKLNKKAYMITPLLFIVFMLISAAFAFYTSRVDKTVSDGIQLSATVEKGVNEVYKEQIDKETFVILSAYSCSNTWCCGSGNNSQIANCISNRLNTIYGSHVWNTVVNCPLNVTFNPNLEAYNKTNINIEPGVNVITVGINTSSLIRC